ncbi:MAG TPA: sigma-70 family RNA polymerase sigma factor, partial [Solirubrobacteraceae bacterium]|nr:sigma-70 family RNA polymerase sigma factor [Solirubrobacteraceae bacterium]
MATATDRSLDLLLRARGGDLDALAELYALHGERIVDYARRVVGFDVGAAEAAHAGFLTLIQGVGRIDSVPDVGMLLFRATRAAALRIAQEDRAAVKAAEEDAAAAAPVEPADPVDRANLELPVPQREALALREVEGRSFAEIGELTGVAPEVAARRTWRARGRLHGLLQPVVAGSRLLGSTDCERALTLLTLREDGPLDPEDERWLQEHLAACDRCGDVPTIMALAGERYRTWIPAAMLLKEIGEHLMTRADAVVAAFDSLTEEAYGAARDRAPESRLRRATRRAAPVTAAGVAGVAATAAGGQTASA